ncbi:MAG: LysR substrate-binding domain-containing protein, partial [Thermoanaerobaculia bacterium]
MISASFPCSASRNRSSGRRARSWAVKTSKGSMNRFCHIPGKKTGPVPDAGARRFLPPHRRRPRAAALRPARAGRPGGRPDSGGRRHREARATVDIVANESVSTYLLPEALAVLRQQWTGTRFSVTVATCQAVREGLAQGKYDV